MTPELLTRSRGKLAALLHIPASDALKGHNRSAQGANPGGTMESCPNPERVTQVKDICPTLSGFWPCLNPLSQGWHPGLLCRTPSGSESVGPAACRRRRRGEKADSFGCAPMSPGVPTISRIQEACQEFWTLTQAFSKKFKNNPSIKISFYNNVAMLL